MVKTYLQKIKDLEFFVKMLSSNIFIEDKKEKIIEE